MAKGWVKAVDRALWVRAAGSSAPWGLPWRVNVEAPVHECRRRLQCASVDGGPPGALGLMERRLPSAPSHLPPQT